MTAFCYVIIIMTVLYLTDKMVCLIYCKSKVKQQKSKGTVRNDSKDMIVEKKGFVWIIKQLLYGWIMYSIVRLGRVPFQKYRIFVLKHIYQMKIDEKVVIYGGFRIRAPWNIFIGKGSVIGDRVQLDGRNGLIIGENVNISSEVSIYTEQHDINDAYFESRDSGGSVMVGNRAWLSSRTTILPNVDIGEGTVLASGALASKDLEAYCVYAGLPAKKIGLRNRNLKYEFDGSYIPFY